MTRKRSVLALLAVLSLPLASCSGSFGDALERSLSADPELENNPNLLVAGGSPAAQTCDPATLDQLPEALPTELCYPNGTVTDIAGADTDTDATAPEAIAIQWSTPDGLEQVWTFYEARLKEAGWELAQRPVTESDGDGDGNGSNTLEAVKAGVRVTVSPRTTPLSSPADSAAGATEDGANDSTAFEVSYQPRERDRSLSPVSIPDTNDEFPSSPDESNGETGASDQNQSSEATTSPTAAQAFTDLDEAPDELQPYLQDLAQLGILTAAEAGDRPAFQPNATVTRRDFARWLFAANNTLHGDRPSRRIRPATDAVQPAFQDVPASDPDFDVIQGLAEAGLIPSPLAGASTAVTFRPDAPLTREDLLLWKVPLDLRQSLPTATVDAVQQTWGFQDAARIDPKALQAVLADYQNADQSNIRRAFGYTTLFQPKKPVSRAEAAATLWFFGYQGDGISAAQVEEANAAEPTGADESADAAI
ncbi:MAG: S-layer homology domain-containing protein [Elainellaceae cyanobacterium]